MITETQTTMDPNGHLDLRCTQFSCYGLKLETNFRSFGQFLPVSELGQSAPHKSFSQKLGSCEQAFIHTRLCMYERLLCEGNNLLFGLCHILKLQKT